MKVIREIVDTFEIENSKGIKSVYYEDIRVDGEIIISITTKGTPVLLKVHQHKNGLNIIYTFKSTNDTFNNYGWENRYLLGYVYLMTKHGKKVDSVCMDDIIDLAERKST